MSRETRTIASATETELEVIRLVKEVGEGIAREGVNFGWNIATIAAIAYQRGLIAGVASVHREQEQAVKMPSEPADAH